MANNRPSNSSSVDNDNQLMLPETWSTCRTQAITGTHNFVVTDFSPLDGMAPGDHVSSGTFFVGGYKWSIRFYPGGDDDSEDDKPSAYTAVRLRLLDGPPGDVRVKFTISLLFDKDDDGQAPPPSPSSEKKVEKKKRTAGQAGDKQVPAAEKKKGGSAGQSSGDHKQVPIIARTFTFTDTKTYNTRRSNNWGLADFIKKSKLKKLPHGFTIRCAVTVLKHRIEDDGAAAAVVAAAAPPPSDLHRDFARMLEAGDGADVTISVGDRTFLAHRYVLAARSRVFRAQLFGAMEESSTGCVRVEDMHPSVFEKLLRFVYTDSLPEASCYEERDDELLAMQHLLVAADRYELKRLGLVCEAKLSSWIDVRSVAAMLGLADRHQSVHLKEACLRFMAWPEMLGAVMQTQGFKDLIASCPLMMKEILDKIASAKT